MGNLFVRWERAATLQPRGTSAAGRDCCPVGSTSVGLQSCLGILWFIFLFQLPSVGTEVMQCIRICPVLCLCAWCSLVCGSRSPWVVLSPFPPFPFS